MLARLLQPLSWLYAALAALHRRAQHVAGTPGVPVLVVGNYIVGGAGKTPTVIAVVQMLRAWGFVPGVISRGYGRRDDAPLHVLADAPAAQTGDEPLLIHLRTGAPVWVGRDRVSVLRHLCAAHPEVDIVVSDDGLQHHRLPRDAQVIVFDERGVGNGLLLPAGPLRQPVPHALPANTLVLYNAAQPSTPLPGWLAGRRLSGVLPLADWWKGVPASADGWQALMGRPLLAVAGIAAPERFFAMLEARGMNIRRLPLPDHAAFDTLPWPAGTPDVVLTEKDAVKLAPGRADLHGRVWVVTLDFGPAAGFADALRGLLPRPRNPR
jgi:tetraacyldisaccharide 4'-kinase